MKEREELDIAERMGGGGGEKELDRMEEEKRKNA